MFSFSKFWKWFSSGHMGTGAIAVEDLQSEDLQRVSDIHSASFVRGWSDGEIEKLLAGPGYFCLVARRPGGGTRSLMGFVIVRGVLDEAEIITIATDPSWRQMGVAGKLMDETIRRLLRDRYNHLFLEVAQGNKPARALYESLGFKLVSERKGYYKAIHNENDDLSNALVMRLDLG